MTERNGHDSRQPAEEPVRGTWRTPGGRAATMWYRDGTNDYNTLNACMTEDEYSLRGAGAGTMVDIGGYLGGVGIGFAIDHPDARVWIVEALSANVELIRRNVAENRLDERVTVLHRAAAEPGRREAAIRWDFEQTESGRHHRFVGNSTLGTEGPAALERVRCISLGELVDIAGPIDLLKIDCEGGEYELFADADALVHVGPIVGEYHDGWDRLVALLQATHVASHVGPATDHFGGFRAVPR